MFVFVGDSTGGIILVISPASALSAAWPGLRLAEIVCRIRSAVDIGLGGEDPGSSFLSE